MLKSVDEITTACCAAKAQGHAADAERSAARVYAAIATFEVARAGHATPYTARNAAVSVRLRTTREVQHGAQNVRSAEFQAEKARRAAKTPLAREYAAKAQEAVSFASNHTDDAMRAACSICKGATLDTWLACEAYKAEPTESD